MTISFTDQIDTLEKDEQGMGVVFVGRRVRYQVPALPEDIAETLRHAHRSGNRVQVTYDTETLLIADVTVPR